MNVLKIKNVSFVNLSIDGYNRKTLTEPTQNDELVGYVGSFYKVIEVDDLIQIANDALTGVFSKTNSNGWIGIDNYDVKITTTNIEFYLDDEITLVATESIIDFLELLNAWKNFLQTPPLNFQKI